VTKEEIKARESDYMFLYSATKIVAEKAIWAFAKEHPELDVAIRGNSPLHRVPLLILYLTVLPGFVYGPFAKHFPLPSATGLSSNNHIYSLMNGKVPHMFPPAVVDVRDVAEAHVLALDLPRKELQEKRYLLVAGVLTWKEAVALLHEVRPGLGTLNPEEIDELPGPVPKFDASKTEQEFGINFIDPKDTIIAAVDSLLEAQKTWEV
jgi:nucleoside-diphosphate-sugar epimerase